MRDWLRRRLRPDPFDDKADPAQLAAAGREVAARLSANPRAEALGGRKADMFRVRDFLSPAECEALIAAIESNIRPSTLFSSEGSAGGRTSSTHYFADGAPATATLAARLDAVMGIPRSHGETIQGQRYRQGEEYRHHCDFFRVEREHWQRERRRGGQRTWSAMIYLNDVSGGGATDFPTLGFAVKPETGMLLTWNNMDRTGRPNRATRHAGMPVTDGVKYVVTQWYRVEEWSLRQR